MQTKSQRAFLKPFSLDIIKYSTFRENCQLSDCTKIDREIYATCVLTKTRPVLSVHRPPRRICENCTKTRWRNPPSFCCLAEQSAEQVVNVDFRLALFLAALCDVNGVGLEIVKHIYRHFVPSVTSHLDKGCQHSGIRGTGIEKLPRRLVGFQQVVARHLFSLFIITKYLFPIFLVPLERFYCIIALRVCQEVFRHSEKFFGLPSSASFLFFHWYLWFLYQLQGASPLDNYIVSQDFHLVNTFLLRNEQFSIITRANQIFTNELHKFTSF